MKPGFLTESTKDFVETPTIGSFNINSDRNSFEDVFEAAHNTLLSAGVDPKVDVNLMIKNDAIMESYKDALLDQLQNDSKELDARSGSSRYSSLYEQTAMLFDNCRDDLISESTRVGQLLPIKAVDFPVLIKQNLALAAKDIMQTEVTKSPLIKKHIERRWIVDNKTDPENPKRYEYPQCFFRDDWKDIWAAGKGVKLDDKVVSIANGACFNYNIPRNLAAGKVEDFTKQNITFNLAIKSVVATGYDDEIPVSMRISLSDNTWIGGQIKDPETGEIIDVVTGTVDFIANTVSLSSASPSRRRV